MSVMRFLVDEDTPQHLARMVQSRQPSVDIVHVGGANAPSKGTLDPDLLAWLEMESRALVSNDHTTLPGHVAQHLAWGNHTWGAFLLRPGFSGADYADDIVLLWAGSEAEEWRDHLGWLPL